MADFFDEPGAPSAPAPSAPAAPAPSGGMQGGWQIPSMKWKGFNIVNPQVNTPAQLSQDQSVAKASEDLKTRLNDLETAVTSQQQRDKNTSTLDKVVGGAVGLYYGRSPFDDPLMGERGNIYRLHRQYVGGYPTQRDAVFTNAGSTRQAIQAWIIAQSKSRNWKAIGDVQNHIPYESDTDELFQKKLAFWKQRLRETDAELQQRQINVPEPTLAPSAGVPEGPTGGLTSTGIPPPPFRAVAKKMIGGYSAIQDANGNWYYYDAGRWNRIGG